jgi:RES domain
VWRCHTRRREALSHEGYRFRSGRFHRGIPDFDDASAWPALYLSSLRHVCLGEYLRHVDKLEDLKDIRISRIQVTLHAVLDCREIEATGVNLDVLLEDLDYQFGQSLAAAAIQRGYEALVLPTATRFHDPNLIVFPTHLRPDSELELLDQEDPHLYIG